MTYFVEAWNLREALRRLKSHDWDGLTNLKLNRLRSKLDAAVQPLQDEIRRLAGSDDVQERANELGRQELDEPPELPTEPLISIEEVKEIPKGIISGDDLETLQLYGVVEKDDEDGES